MKLLLLGATGLVGSHLLDLALADPRVQAVTAPSRRALPPHAKLHAPQAEFDALPAQAAWWQADAAICALGSTMKRAGSREAFHRIDHGYPLAAARLARQHGTPTFVLNSALGADPASMFFYNRVKGELERDLATLGFGSLTFARPGLIGGERGEFRLGERIGLQLQRLAAPLLPRRWRINPAATIAREMLQAALVAKPGVHVIDSAALV